MAEKIVDKLTVLGQYNRTYNLYFTDIRIVGEFIGGSNPAVLAGGLIGKAIADKRHEKKGKEMIMEEKTPEQILAAHKKNFSIDYNDIDKAVVKKNLCKMKFIQRLPIVGKKTFFLFNKKDKNNVASVLTKVIPNKVIVK